MDLTENLNVYFFRRLPGEHWFRKGAQKTGQYRQGGRPNFCFLAAFYCNVCFFCLVCVRLFHSQFPQGRNLTWISPCHGLHFSFKKGVLVSSFQVFSSILTSFRRTLDTPRVVATDWKLPHWEYLVRGR